MQDRCRFPSCFGRGAVQVRLDLVTPLVMLPLGVFVASMGFFFTCLVFSGFAVSLWTYYRVWKRRPQRTRTKFFYMWAMTSSLLMYYLFEIIVAIYREVLFWENLLLSAMFAAMMYHVQQSRRSPGTLKKSKSAITLRQQNGQPGHNWEQQAEDGAYTGDSNGYHGQQHSHSNEVSLGIDSSGDTWCTDCQTERVPHSAHCPVCGVCVKGRDHHCIWIDNCVGENNHRPFFLALLLFLLSGCYGSHLLLTTVCTPEMYYDWFLFPADCRFVYNDILSALGYVCAWYTLLSACGMSLVLLYQVVLISQNVTSQDLRIAGQHGNVSCGVWLRGNSRSKGFWRNWRNFLSRRRNASNFSNSFENT